MKKARYYQTEAHEAIRSAFKRGLRRVLIELGTGLGKTVIFVLLTLMVRAKGGKVLIIVNRDVLVTQALAELKVNGVYAHREQAEDRAAMTADVVVGSVQSMQGKWLQRWPKDYFKVVVTDECHGSAAKTFKNILDHFGNAYHVGVTATAERHDRKGLWAGYQDIVYRMPLNSWVDKDTGETTVGGIDDGWLVPFDFHDLEVPVPLDERIMRKASFSEDEEVFNPGKYMPLIADEVTPYCQGKKGLFFLPNCRMSKGFSDLLKERGLPCEHIDSSYMTPTETTRLLEWFATTPDAILSNSDLLSVGFNDKAISVIGMIRPVASLPMYKQRLGRGTRTIANVDDYETADERKAAIAASDKPCCVVLNPFWENTGHNLATPSALITDNKEEREELDKARKAGRQVDLAQLQKQLKAKRMADQDEQMRKLAEKLANSQEQMKRAKGGGKLYIADILRHRNPTHKPASDAFVKFVRRMGADIPPGEYSAYQIMRIKERIEKQKAA